MKTLDVMPMTLAAAVGKRANDRPAGVEADEVEALRGRCDVAHQAGGRRQHAGLMTAARRDGLGQLQVRVIGDVGQLRLQRAALGKQSREVRVEPAGQRQRALDATRTVHDRQRRIALADMRRLAHGGVIEADEVRSLGLQVQRDAVDAIARDAQRRGERVEEGTLAQVSPPNTATRLNLHAGAAWPTRITCDGSPLPQNGVPVTWKVDASPTIASERQKVALMPR